MSRAVSFTSGQGSSLRHAGQGSRSRILSDTLPYPGICFVPVRHRTPACWGRELGTQGEGVIGLQVPQALVSLLHPGPDDVSQDEQLDVSHSGTSAFSPLTVGSGTGADAAGLPRLGPGGQQQQQHRVQQLGIRCAPPKTAHPKRLPHIN